MATKKQAKPTKRKTARKSPAKTGRPTLLDARVESRLLKLLRVGNSSVDACRVAGVSYATFKRWMARGRSDAAEDALFRGFRAKVTKARHEAVTKLVEGLHRQGARGNTKATLAMLAALRPHRFGKRVETSVSGSLDVQVTDLAAAAQRVRARLEAAKASPPKTEES